MDQVYIYIYIYIYIYKEIQILSVTFVQYLNIHHLYCGCS